jgi:hypothetical protein
MDRDRGRVRDHVVGSVVIVAGGFEQPAPAGHLGPAEQQPPAPSPDPNQPGTRSPRRWNGANRLLR